MAKKSQQSNTKTSSAEGTKIISPSQGTHAVANVASNQTKLSSAKDSRSGGKRNA